MSDQFSKLVLFLLLCSSLSEPPPGSAMSIAKQFLLTVLTQFAERRVFVYLFRHDHKGLRY